MAWKRSRAQARECQVLGKLEVVVREVTLKRALMEEQVAQLE